MYCCESPEGAEGSLRLCSASIETRWCIGAGRRSRTKLIHMWSRPFLSLVPRFGKCLGNVAGNMLMKVTLWVYTATVCTWGRKLARGLTFFVTRNNLGQFNSRTYIHIIFLCLLLSPKSPVFLKQVKTKWSHCRRIILTCFQLNQLKKFLEMIVSKFKEDRRHFSQAELYFRCSMLTR